MRRPDLTLKHLLLGFLVLLAMALAWRYRAALLGAGDAPPARPARIEFDNGTVREYAPAPAGQAAAQARPPGGVRKCRNKAGELAYTDGLCPPGSKELALAGGTVTVVPGLAAGAGPAAKPGADPKPAAGLLAPMQPAVPDIRQKMIERAVNH